MLHLIKYSEILVAEEVKDFVFLNFSEYFKSIKEEQNLRKIAKIPLYLSSNSWWSRKTCAIKFFW